VIVVVGLSHKTAPIEVREKLAVGKPESEALVRAICAGEPGAEKGEVPTGAVVLSTCNRVEVFAEVQGGDGAADAALRHVTSELRRVGGEAVAPHLREARGTEAVLHAFRVASSLDSLVVGEPQILGQLKDAFEAARSAGTLGPELGHLANAAIRVGKRVRSETAIGAGQVSVPSVAVEYAKQVFSELRGCRVLVLGAGEMAEAAARILEKQGATLTLVNRSRERAEALAKDLSAVVRPWSELEAALGTSDIVLSSTASPTPVLTRDLVRRVQKARRHRSLFLIDIAVPRDIEASANELDNVYLYNVDDLSQIVAETLETRASEVDKAEVILRRELEGFLAKGRERSAAPTIQALRARVTRAAQAELERSLSGKLRHLGQPERDALRVMLDACVNRILHEPSTRLRQLATEGRADEVAEVITELFGLDDAPGDVDAPMSPAEEKKRAAERPS